MFKGIKQLFCKHDFIMVSDKHYYPTQYTKGLGKPYNVHTIYKCNKCGYINHMRYLTSGVIKF